MVMLLQRDALRAAVLGVNALALANETHPCIGIASRVVEQQARAGCVWRAGKVIPRPVNAVESIVVGRAGIAIVFL